MIPISEWTVQTVSEVVNGVEMTWVIPKVLPFSGGTVIKHGWHTIEVVGFRPPRKGEYYLSGAIPGIYQTQNDLTMPFLVVEPGTKVKVARFWVEEE